MRVLCCLSMLFIIFQFFKVELLTGEMELPLLRTQWHWHMLTLHKYIITCYTGRSLHYLAQPAECSNRFWLRWQLPEGGSDRWALLKWPWLAWRTSASRAMYTTFFVEAPYGRRITTGPVLTLTFPPVSHGLPTSKALSWALCIPYDFQSSITIRFSLDSGCASLVIKSHYVFCRHLISKNSVDICLSKLNQSEVHCSVCNWRSMELEIILFMVISCCFSLFCWDRESLQIVFWRGPATL